MPERKGLRFEVFDATPESVLNSWTWNLIGKDDEVYARAAMTFADEADARSNISRVRKVFKGAGYAKVITL